MIISTYVENSGMGFGDFIKGSIYLYKICKKYKLKFDIDLRYHSMSKYFKNCKKYKYLKSDVKIFNNTGYKNIKPDFFYLFNACIQDAINIKGKKFFICSNVFPNSNSQILRN